MSNRTQRSWYLIFYVFAALALLAGCSDDKPTAPRGVSGVVVDANGEGISGAAVGLVYRFDGLTMPGDWEQIVTRPADKPATTVTFDLPAPGHATVEVFDYAGDLVTVLLDGEVPEGQFNLIWDATDSSGQPVPAGMYYVHITLPDQPVVIQNIFLYLFEAGEILRAPRAVTDADGSFTIDGALIPVGAQFAATDETGQTTSTATVSSAIQVKAVISINGLLKSDSQVIDWVPQERLGGVRIVLH